MVSEFKLESSVWSFWKTLFGAIVVAVLVIVVNTVVVTLYLSVKHDSIQYEEMSLLISQLQFDGNFVAISTIAVCVILVPVILGIIKLQSSHSLVDFLELRMPSWKQFGFWLLILLSFLVLSSILSTLLGKPISPEFMKRVVVSGDPIWVLTVALVVAAPLTEEFFFRGYLHSGLESSFLGVGGTVIFTSAFFAIIHTQYSLDIIIHIFIVGVILSLSRVYTGSLVVPIGLHAFNNFLSLVVVSFLV